METTETNENMFEMKCWVCRRNRNDLTKTVKQYWENEEIDENLCIEEIKDGVYLDVAFESIPIRKKHSKDTMQIWVCAICAKLIRTILKNALRVKTD